MQRVLGIAVIAAALVMALLPVRRARNEWATLHLLQQGGSMLGVLPPSLTVNVPDFDPGRGIPYPEDWALTRAVQADAFPRDADGLRAFAARHPHPPRGDLWNAWRAWPNQGSIQHQIPPRHPADPVERRSPDLPPAPVPEPDAARTALDDAGTVADNGAPPADSAPPEAEAGDGPEADAAASPDEPGNKDAGRAGDAAPSDEDSNAAVWDAFIDYLRAADPGNGWPLFLRAKRDLDRSVREYTVRIPDDTEPSGERGVIRWEVMPADAALAARAAREAHEAARAARFDQAFDDLARAEFTRLGGRASSLAQFVRDTGVYAGTLLPHLQMMRAEARAMMAEAERRAASPPEELEDGLDAYTILDDQLTLSARFMEGETSLISMLVGMAVQAIVAEEGDRILRAAGRPEEAERLVARARRLARPWALTGARNHILDNKNNPSPRRVPFLYRDPGILAEAQALVDGRAAAPAGPAEAAEDKDWGLVGGMLVPAMGRALYAPDLAPSRAEARWSARFEFLGFLRMGLIAVTFPLYGWLLGWLAAHGLNLLVFRRLDPSSVPPWPGPLGIVAGSLLFAVPLAGCWYGLILFPGSPLAQALGLDFTPGGTGWNFMAWTVFWPIWGAMTGWNLLLYYAGRSARRAPSAGPDGDRDPDCDDRTKGFRRGGRRLVVGCLAGSALATLLSALVADDAVLGAVATPATVAAFAALGLVALATIPQWLDAWLWKPMAARARGRNRRVLVGLAGGLLLWTAFQVHVAERERHYAAGDTVLIPDLDRDPYSVFSPIEGRVVQRYRRHLRAALREEARLPDSAPDARAPAGP